MQMPKKLNATLNMGLETVLGTPEYEIVRPKSLSKLCQKVYPSADLSQDVPPP